MTVLELQAIPNGGPAAARTLTRVGAWTHTREREARTDG